MNKVGTEARRESRKFASDIVWVAVAQLLVAAFGIIKMPALTKNYSSELYGVWINMNVTVGLLIPILSLHFSTALVRFIAAEEDRGKRNEAFSTMLWPILLMGLLSIGIASLLRTSLSSVLFSTSKYMNFIPLTLLWAFSESLLTFLLSYMRARGKLKKLSTIQATLLLCKVALILILSTLGYSLGWIVASMICTVAAFTIPLFIMIVRDIGMPRISAKGLTGFIVFSIPQIPSGILLWIIALSDRGFITHFIGLSASGVYSASYTLGSLLALLYGPIAFVLLPTVSRLWELGQKNRVRKYMEYSTKLFVLLAVPAATGLYILSQPLLKSLTTAEYAVGGNLVFLVGLATICLGIYQMNIYIILLVKKTPWLVPMVGLAAAVNIGLNIILIPRVGIIGAAISTIAAYFCLACIVTVWARRVLSYRVDWMLVGKVLAATIIMAIALKPIHASSLLSIILVGLMGAVIYVLCLLLLRPFSSQDWALIRQIFAGLMPRRTAKKAAAAGVPAEAEQREIVD